MCIRVAGKYFVHRQRPLEEVTRIWMESSIALSAKLTTEIHLCDCRLIDVFHLNFGSILIKTDEHEKELTIVQSAAVRHRKERKQPTIQDVKQKENPGAENRRR